MARSVGLLTLITPWRCERQIGNVIVNITLRPTLHTDYPATESLIRDAFWDLYRPGCVEHLVARQLRSGSDLLLDLVAEQESQLRGCLLVTKARLVHPDGQEDAMCSLGPIAVAPGHQRQGVGARLITRALELVAAAGVPAVFLYGDPDYYGRFGFLDAATWAVTTPEGANFDAFRGLELRPGALDACGGRLLDSPDFEVQPDRLAACEQDFPARIKHCLPGQLFD